MSSLTAQPQADPDAESFADAERDLLDRQLATLDRLAAMGMTIAGAIEQDVLSGEADATRAAIDFARVARAVRLSLALQSKLLNDAKGRPTSAANDDEEIRLEAVWADPEPHPADLRKQDLAAHVAKGVERLALECAERLERDDIHALLNRPFEELAAVICQELGLDQAALPTRPPPPQAGEVAQRAGGGQPPLSLEPNPSENPCALVASISNVPDS